ncbi:unnamed protein product [Pleuronectes platessa]|uniref:Uncharacterized protein n=1 Tax=Pleuronectes platessa TaxID=8262 RepID=A0A9N7UM65_PLEPL|nr:unnamed protein product [Pleuronectes platessa]
MNHEDAARPPATCTHWTENSPSTLSHRERKRSEYGGHIQIRKLDEIQWLWLKGSTAGQLREQHGDVNPEPAAEGKSSNASTMLLTQWFYVDLKMCHTGP